MYDNWLTEPLARIHAMEERHESIGIEIADKYLHDNGTPKFHAYMTPCYTLGMTVFETGADELRALFGDDLEDMDEDSLEAAYKARSDVRDVVDAVVARILEEQVNKEVAA